MNAIGQQNNKQNSPKPVSSAKSLSIGFSDSANGSKMHLMIRTVVVLDKGGEN